MYLPACAPSACPRHASAAAEADPLEQFARIDHGRQSRTGMPEVVYGQGKTAQQMAAILTAMADRATQAGGQGGGQRAVMATRVDAEAAQQVCAVLPSAIYHPLARVLHLPLPLPPTAGAEASEAGESGAGSAAESAGDSGGGREGTSGHVMVVTAGTTDLPVAEEARVTLELMGVPVGLIADVGVAGLHRVITQLPRIRQAAVVIVVAGMDGALPSVISGLVDMPVIAVPTSPSTLHSPSHSLHSPSHSLHSPSHSLHSPSHSLHSPSHSLHSPSHSLHSPSHSLHSLSLHSPSPSLPVFLLALAPGIPFLLLCVPPLSLPATVSLPAICLSLTPCAPTFSHPASPLYPTPPSVGYGASFGGVAALLAALNACAPGVTVVNIDNGFGAAAAAARILLRRQS
ncbi:unnamed protein product [Closterium sp. Naga37s-1]|nr:unnamed protein product [Closterium sp. Naga37s-1]